MKIKPYKKIGVGPMYFDNSVMDHNTRTPLNQTGKKKKREEEEEPEEIGVREWDWEKKRDRERERKLILGSRDDLKTQRFRLGFLLFFFSLTCRVQPCPGSVRLLKKGKDTRAAVSRTRTTRERQANCRVSCEIEPTDKKCDAHKATIFFPA